MLGEDKLATPRKPCPCLLQLEHHTKAMLTAERQLG